MQNRSFLYEQFLYLFKSSSPIDANRSLTERNHILSINFLFVTNQYLMPIL